MFALDMIPSMFIDHVYYWGDTHVKNLGAERGKRISPAKSAFNRDLKVNFHQDSPIVPPNMLQTLWTAANRKPRIEQTIGADQRIDIYDALKAVTINVTYAYHEEKRKGTLTVGKVADLVILGRNPLDTPLEASKDIQVIETTKEGINLYRA